MAEASPSVLNNLAVSVIIPTRCNEQVASLVPNPSPSSSALDPVNEAKQEGEIPPIEQETDQVVRKVLDEVEVDRHLQSRPFRRLSLFDRLRVIMVGLKTVTCNKCGRVWHEPLLERIVTNAYGETKVVPTIQTAEWCSRCTPPTRPPVEGETFRRKRAKRRGRLVLHGWRDRPDRGNRDRVRFSGESLDVMEPASMDDKLTELAINSRIYQHQEEQKREALERENILTKEWLLESASQEDIRRTSRLLAASSRGKLARQFGLSDSEIRAGKTERVLKLLESASTIEKSGKEKISDARSCTST